MTRIVEDKNGAYDLAHVIEITSVEQVMPGPNNTRIPDVPTARLHFDSGVVRQTLLKYAPTRELWLAVKAAEQHPIDGIRGAIQ